MEEAAKPAGGAIHWGGFRILNWVSVVFIDSIESRILYGAIGVALLAWGGYVPHRFEWTLFACSMMIRTVIAESLLHRYFAHRAFKVRPAVRPWLAVIAAMSGQDTPLFWATMHRKHHRLSDRPGDPHSPHAYPGAPKNRWFGYFWGGWMGVASYDVAPDLAATKDVAYDEPLMRVISYSVFWFRLSLLLPAIVGAVAYRSFAGFVIGLVWGGWLATWVSVNMMRVVNLFCHLWGTRRFRTGDASGDIWLLSIPTGGTALHNTHHAFPFTATNDLFWWYRDPSAWVLRFFKFLGVVTEMRRPSPELIAARRRRSVRIATKLDCEVTSGSGDPIPVVLTDVSVLGASFQVTATLIGGMKEQPLALRFHSKPLLDISSRVVAMGNWNCACSRAFVLNFSRRIASKVRAFENSFARHWAARVVGSARIRAQACTGT